jgi:GT2 family glycosyltransferase
LLNADGTVQPNAFRFPTLAMALLDLFPLPWFVPGRVRARLYRSRLNGRYPQEETAHRPFRIDHPLGACMLINRRAYEQAGGFDHALFMYSEEVDLALRYRKAGWQCWQVPQAVVTHFGGQSTRQLPDRMFVELWRSRLYVYARHYSRTSQALLRLILALAQLRDLAFTLLLYALGRIGPHEAQRRVRRASAVLRLVRWR